jgi:uncharacterized protein DUF499
MNTSRQLRPWTEVIRPHEDIIGGQLEMSTYAADIGAVDRGDARAPKVYTDAREFFLTTYPSRSLRALVEDVLRVLSGGPGDRVLQLRTPFGGGKTHALLALYHLVRSPDAVPPGDFAGLTRVRGGRAAVLSCLDLDPRRARVADGIGIRTLWGELAFRLGGQPGYELVREHDEARSAPGGDLLRLVIGSGPVLVLLDEVLGYVERAGGGAGDDPLRRQVLLFLQGLTEVVRGLPHAAMVYSLQASVREAAGDEALLQELDHLVGRVDAKREPVSDDEVIRVVQRRLFPSFGTDPAHLEVAREVGSAYAIAVRRLRETYAETESDRRAVGLEAERFERRVVDAYPFHPALLDLMYHRWGSLPSYQRTRGALQFLATTVHALIQPSDRPASPLISAGDVRFDDEAVRSTFFSQVGEREQYMSVLAADLIGDGARVREVDRRVGADSPQLERLRVGTRCAAAIMLFSFGARQGEERGVLESELVQALVDPSIDRNMVTACLHDLREELLYLHYTGRRYRFEPKANLNLLIAEEASKLGPDEVLNRIKRDFDRVLAPARDQAVLWPTDPGAVADREPQFRLVYLGPDVADDDPAGVEAAVTRFIRDRGTGQREYRNALGFVIPTSAALDRARHAARTVMAVEAVQAEAKARSVPLDSDQSGQLEERRRAAAADLSGNVERTYETVLIPTADRSGGGAYALERVDLRAQITAGRDLHRRVLDGLRKHVFEAVTPTRLLSLTGLGDGRAVVPCQDLVDWFFSYFDFPKLTNERALKGAIGAGTTDLFGYVSGARKEGDAVVPARTDLIRFGKPTPEDEVDLGPGCFLISAALANKLRGAGGEQPVAPQLPPAEDPVHGRAVRETATDGHRYHLAVTANAAQLFRLLPAVQNLADRAEDFSAHLDITAEARQPFERSWLRNAVDEHLDEAGVKPERSELQ